MSQGCLELHYNLIDLSIVHMKSLLSLMIKSVFVSVGYVSNFHFMPFDRKMEGTNICWMSIFLLIVPSFFIIWIRAGIAAQGPLLLS